MDNATKKIECTTEKLACKLQSSRASKILPEIVEQAQLTGRDEHLLRCLQILRLQAQLAHCIGEIFWIASQQIVSGFGVLLVERLPLRIKTIQFLLSRSHRSGSGFDIAHLLA